MSDVMQCLVRRAISPRPVGAFLRATGLLATALVVGIELAAPAAAQASATVSAHALTPRRLVASLAVLVALTGAVIGGLALARAAGGIGANGRRGANVALVLGPIGLVVGGLVVANAKGGLGTGNGIAGGVVAMVVGLIGITLGGLALARSRRAS